MKFAQSKGFKILMSRLYGWGASLVILGALFKINHYPGAEYMLIIGLGTEAIIFFFSGFEKPHEEPDWSLVYPELAGIDTDDTSKSLDRDRRGGQMIAGTTNVQSIALSSNLDKMLEEANIGPELIENLSRGLKNLSDNASRLADVSNAAVATQGYIQNMEAASQSVLELSQSYKNTNEYLKHDLSLSEEYANSLRNAVGSMNQLSETYKDTASSVKENLKTSEDYNESIRNITGYTNELAANYGKSSELLMKTVEALESSTNQGAGYSEQLQKTSQNLEALNAVYELQLQASDAQYQSTSKVQETFSKLVDNLNETAGSTEKYKEEMAALTKNIAALNSVYGNMLTAMNFNAPR
ncbi:MAG: gliding motility protein GldL [Bacteroidetes bacterium]|nr:MAG: gliding motility protein GldL [Bacteroidota bacterium]